jgi:hypothetical protein
MEHLTEACWDGYKQEGMKNKSGKMVPNCVPVEEGLKDIVTDLKNFGRIQAATIGKQPGDAAELRNKINALLAKNKANKAMKTSTNEEHELNHGEYCPRCLATEIVKAKMQPLQEAEYQGRTVALGKPMRGDVKKFKVFVRDPQTGNVKKVNFGDKTMRIKKSNPARRKSFRARHNCANPGPRTKARFWSCRKW